MVVVVILWGWCSAGVLRRMNGREIQKAAADFTEAQMKPSNMQNLSTVLNRMIMTKQDDEDYNDDSNSGPVQRFLQQWLQQWLYTMIKTMITTTITTIITTTITTIIIIMTITQDRYNNDYNNDYNDDNNSGPVQQRGKLRGGEPINDLLHRVASVRLCQKGRRLYTNQKVRTSNEYEIQKLKKQIKCT